MIQYSLIIVLIIFQVWNFLGAILLSAVGINSLIVWAAAKANDSQVFDSRGLPLMTSHLFLTSFLNHQQVKK